MNNITYQDFEDIDIRVGTIIEANVFEKAKNPAYQLLIDFGEIGTKKSSAQITDLYSNEDLIGKQILAVVNFPPKQIANFISECLVLGLTENKKTTLITTDKPTQNGLKLH
jgi:tRNA-binding protein